MKGWQSPRQLKRHLASNGSDVQIKTDRQEVAARRSAAAYLRRRQAHPEHDEQVRLVQWARAHQDRHEALRLFHAIPNGGYRSKRTAALMKAEGALAGVPDLSLPCPRFGADGQIEHGLYIEMKSPKGRLSENQKAVIALLRKGGYRVVVCYSAAEAVTEIAQYLDIGEEEYDPV